MSVDLPAGLAATLTLSLTTALGFGLSQTKESEAARGSNVATDVGVVASGCFMGTTDVVAGFFTCGTFFTARGVVVAGLAMGGDGLEFGLTVNQGAEGLQEVQVGAVGGTADGPFF